jgi:hypothetical protein
MWRRLARRTFAAGRPAAFPEQWPLVIVTALAVAGGIAVAIRVLGG